ncbi:hypothetical protein CF098_09190 [Clostridium sporogenes]
MIRSTDVKESIAGYYYQLLIACRELCSLANIKRINHQNSVGIEKGSDIKIFKIDGNETSIEAKFYKISNFNKKSLPIIHTIYNFHNSYKGGAKSGKYIFSTNVGMHDSDSDFFENWPKDISDDLTEYIQFVKLCVIRESIKRKEFINNFNDYKDKYKAKSILPTNPKYELSFYTDLLIEDLCNGIEDFSKFGDLMDEDSLKEFIIRIEFQFSERKKFEEVLSIKNKIYDSIKLIDNEIEVNDSNIIMNLMMDKFLDTTITGKNVSVADLLTIIKQYKDDKYSYRDKAIFDDRITCVIETIEEEINRFNSDISDLKLKNNILENFIDITELFYKHIEGLECDVNNVNYFIGRYSLDSKDPIIITNLARVVSMLTIFGNIDEFKISLFEQNSINNIIFDDDNKFCFKESASRNINTTNQLVHDFINKTKADLARISGDEVVVFSPPNFRECEEPCNLKNGEIELMVSNIANVRNNFKIRDLYSGMDYRCIKCLEMNKQDEDMVEKVKRFREGCIWKK